MSENISNALSILDMSAFSELEWIYEDFQIDSNLQISQTDINSLKDVKNKFRKIELAMMKVQDTIIQKYNIEFKELLAKDAEKKERQLEMLKFFKSIGFDIISKGKTDSIINFINARSWKFGLDSKIDFENGHIGFNKDFWDKKISTLEKKHFICLFNKILWADVIDENIANGTSALSLEAISRIQRLGNRGVELFVGNVDEH